MSTFFRALERAEQDTGPSPANYAVGADKRAKSSTGGS